MHKSVEGTVKMAIQTIPVCSCSTHFAKGRGGKCSCCNRGFSFHVPAFVLQYRETCDTDLLPWHRVKPFSSTWDFNKLQTLDDAECSLVTGMHRFDSGELW